MSAEPAKPSVAVVFGAVAPPAGDVVEVFVHLGCSKEVGSFEVKLANWDGKYSAGGAYPIGVGVDGSISVGRGVVCPLLMTCHVETVACESTPAEHYVKVSGRCWGERLFRRVVTATYSSLKGEEVVKDLMDYYAGLSHVRSSAELVESTDTTFSQLEYVDSPVWDILKYVAECSDKAGVIGFTFRVAPDGKFEFFPKGSKTNSVDLVDKIETATVSKNISRVRNKVTVYGLADKSVPADKVSWTRSLTPADGAWSGVSGSLSVGVGPDGGSCVVLSASSLAYGSALFTLNAGKEVNCELYPLVDVQLKLGLAYSGNGVLNLFDVSGKVATKAVSVSPDGTWHVVEVGVGLAYANQWDSVEVGFDWAHVNRARLDFYFAEGSGSGSFSVHGLYFGGRRYSAVVEDGASQSSFGLREYVETDEELWSDNECDLRAQSLLDYLKDPAENLLLLSTVIDYGLAPVLGGDVVHVELPNENVNDDYCVESVEYRAFLLEDVLELTLELGKTPPQIADYLYGLRTFTVNVEKLSRTKIGKRGVPVATGGGGASSSSYFKSDVEIDKTSPVLNLLTSRVLKAAFGFDGANTFLATYTGDLILRAASHIIRPYVSASDDLGSATFPFGNAYINGLCSVGWLNVGGFTVLTAARVLQNVTADAGIITGGEFPMARMPREAAGLVLESQGLGFWPMYVDPDYRFLPAFHYHSAADITSGGVTEDVAVAKVGGGTRTLHFVNSKYTGYTDS